MQTQKSDFTTFFSAYITAALWSSQDEDYNAANDRASDQNLEDFSVDDFTPEALEELRAHAFSFWCRMWYYLDSEKDFSRTDDKAGSAGHDFWLTSQGHGAGFWDGDWPKYGDMFTRLSKCYPSEINITVDGDGKLCV